MRCTSRSTKRVWSPISPGSALPVLQVASAAEDRQHYLMRPDLGRRLAPGAEAALAPHAGRHDVAFVVTDGLSARAVQTHAPPVLAGVLPALRAEGWRIAPLVVVRHGRVAIGDAIAALLRRRLRGGADRRAPGPDRARQHGRVPDLAAAARRPPTPTATASPTSGPTASAMPTPPSSSRICCAPCARGASRACSSRMIRIGCWLALPSKAPHLTPGAPHENLDRPHPHHAHRQPAAAEAADGPHPRPREGRQDRRRHLRGRDRQGGRRGRRPAGRRPASTSSATAR